MTTGEFADHAHPRELAQIDALIRTLLNLRHWSIARAARHPHRNDDQGLRLYATPRDYMIAPGPTAFWLAINCSKSTACIAHGWRPTGGHPVR